MDQAVTVGNVLAVIGVVGGGILALAICFAVLSSMASGWDH